MKIVHAVYSDRKGGLEQAFVNTTRMLLSLNHEVQLWVPSKAPYLDEMELLATRIDLTSHGYFDLLAMVRHHLRLRITAPDLIITHNSRATSLLARAATGLNIPHIAFSHGYKTRRFKKVDHLVALTEDMRQHFISAGHSPECVSVFPNVIEQIPDLVSKALPVEGEPIRLGFAGRLNEEKGLEDLMRAIAILKNRCFVELHIAGSGPDQLIIEGLAQELGIEQLIVFSGWVDDIQNWMNSIDLMIVPSRAESFGIVVLEAAAYGCPVIATDVAGPSSQITSGIDGWLVKKGSPDSIAETIELVISRSELWNPIRVKAHERAKGYLIERKKTDLEKILTHLIRTV